jgi:hypothetical protein
VHGDEAANWPRLNQIQSKRCELCDRMGTDVDTCYIRLQGFSLRIRSVSERWVNIQCSWCSGCYRKGRRITWVRVFGIVFIFGPLIFVFAASLLMAALFGPDASGTRMPEDVFGIPRKKIGDFYGVGSLLSLLWLFVSPFIVGMLMRRRIKRLLGPHLDEQLLSLAGGSRWGLVTRIALLRQIPHKESFIRLR